MFLGKGSRFRYKYITISVLIALIIFFAINITLRMVYPINYIELINKYSNEYNVDPHLVAAIINVESKYDIYAKSNKEARGLMQISPSTGAWASKELQILDFSLEYLYKPEVNIRIGCWYLDKLNVEFNSNLRTVLAAYNGGSGNVNKWLNDNRYSQDGESLSNIPFKETDEYVEKVLKNYKIYKKVYKNTFKAGQSIFDKVFGKSLLMFKKIIKGFMSNV